MSGFIWLLAPTLGAYGLWWAGEYFGLWPDKNYDQQWGGPWWGCK